jgi:transposase
MAAFETGTPRLRRQLKVSSGSSVDAVAKLTDDESRHTAERPLLDVKTRALLERWVRASTTPQRLVRRTRIVLLAADGVARDDIAERLGVSRPTVQLWIGRFERSGPESLQHDAPGRGRRPSVDAKTMRVRLEQAQLLTSDGYPISLRRAAAFLQVSPTAVWRAMRKTLCDPADPSASLAKQ